VPSAGADTARSVYVCGRPSDAAVHPSGDDTGVPVHCVLPDFVVRELEAAPKSSEGHFFWTGKSKLHSAIGKWQRRLQTLFILAKLPVAMHTDSGHIRSGAASRRCAAGTCLRSARHQSLRITERHYSPGYAPQEQLEQDLRRAWSEDPLRSCRRRGRQRYTRHSTH